MEYLTKFLFSENAFWVTVSGLISWGITHQAAESSREIGKLVEAVKQSGTPSIEVTKLEKINEAVEEYRRQGTPVRVIDTYTDLNDELKADIYDAVMLRVKGRLGKSNKYRKGKT